MSESPNNALPGTRVPFYRLCRTPARMMTAIEMTQPGIGRSTFLDHLKKSDLLPTKQLERLVADLAPTLQTGSEIAERLVHSQVLTRFQAARLLVGKSDGLVVGQYVLQEYLGRGAAGRLYKARHRAMNRSVCVQILASEHTRDVASRHALQEECRAAAQLVNSHIVTILDVNQVQQRMYLVTEYVDGASCETLLQTTGPMELKAAVEIVRQAAVGLHFAHERGVTHGRLCPDTVLVGRATSESTQGKPIAKIAGFGLRSLPDSPEEMLIAYATRAPEQFTNPTKREPKSDVYALGCILYYLLTRRLPYQATTPEELVRCHRKAAVPNIQQECPTIPNTVANLITRMLAKKPEDRLTAAEVAFYLENSLPAQDSGRFEFGAQPQMSGPLSFVGHQLSGLTAQASVPLPDHAMIDEDVEVIHESQFDGENTKRMSDHTPVSVNPRKARSKRRKSQRKGIHPLALFTLVITVGLITFLVLFKMVKFLGG